MAEIIKASYTLSRDGDVVTVYAEPTPPYWVADPLEENGLVAILRETDEEFEKETGAIAGIEIVGFKDFARWDDIPDLPGLWQLEGAKPLPLRELLRQIQSSLKRDRKKSIANN